MRLPSSSGARRLQTARGLFANLFRRDTPERGFGYPTLFATGGNLAPIETAFSETADHPCFGLGNDLGLGIGSRQKRRALCLEKNCPNARQKTVVDPAALPFMVFDAPPVTELCRDTQWQIATREDPVDAVTEARAAPNIAFGGLERDKARQRQVRNRPPCAVRLRKRRCRHRGTQKRQHGNRAQRS